MTEFSIEFINFNFHYRTQENPTLIDINLHIKKGEKVLIAGPSGSGKSTIAHCINGLVPHYYKGKTSGAFHINGQDAATMAIFDRSKLVGTVLQDSDGQFVGQTVGEDISFSLENECVPLEIMRERVKEVSELVHIENHLHSAPQDISGGQKQRVSLAGVLVDYVDILLFDEPLANLDPATGRYAMELIDELAAQTGKTIIIIEHRLEDVLWRPIDRIVLMDKGRIVADDTPARILTSGLLKQYGIREPLYVTALSYAGVQIDETMHPQQLETLTVEAVREPLCQWDRQASLPAAVPQRQPILSFNQVHFAYDDSRIVLHDISFDIHEGEMAAIVGKNGAGKSTLCKLICGFEKPIEGEISMEGKNLNGVSIRERANTVGYVMQNPNQMISKVMIRDEVGLGLKLRDVPPAEIEERVNHALKICGLYPFRNWPISALSYGQKKRVTIASILVLQPKIILLDEPTAGQDFRHYTEIMEFLETLQQQSLTILLVTHDMHLMLEYTRRAIVIADGKMICDESPSYVLTNPDVIRAANLKETSLLTLAEKTGIPDPLRFVQRFIHHDREARNAWRA